MFTLPPLLVKRRAEDDLKLRLSQRRKHERRIIDTCELEVATGNWRLDFITSLAFRIQVGGACIADRIGK